MRPGCAGIGPPSDRAARSFTRTISPIAIRIASALVPGSRGRSRPFTFVYVKKSLQTRYRHSPPRTDLDGRGKLARTAQAVQGVRVHADSAGGLRERDQQKV